MRYLALAVTLAGLPVAVWDSPKVREIRERFARRRTQRRAAK